ncbi:dihydroxyacetone phosphate acyltransferase-like protein [Labeo rohita]|uniref:Dihydroxyacetone phosphate acyltransferase-like protein n=1 Tax=Labeo rohita TaxID=84645 RepID=A0A498P000_LABRO|nr:dihydroxyacetone phosphate acyltransferase-like protein [Labeo rohita]
MDMCLADIRSAEKVWFLNTPMSRTGHFGDTVENFAQHFSVAQKKTEVIKHILSWQEAAASTWPQHLSLLVGKGGPLHPPALQQPPAKWQHEAGSRQPAPLIQTNAKPRKSSILQTMSSSSITLGSQTWWSIWCQAFTRCVRENR